MSGIIGYLGSGNAVTIMVEGLKKLEYRGYDSAGIAVLSGEELQVRKETGEIKNLETLLSRESLKGFLGIGHTRWATHGRASLVNAHPQVAGNIALVHNGVIENYIDLKESLSQKGCVFVSETDTEVLAHLINIKFKGSLEEAVEAALKEIEGTYALIVLSSSDSDKLVTAVKGNPIVIGLGAGEFLIASDVVAVLPYTKDVILLSDGERAVVTKEGVDICDSSGKEVTKKIKRIGWDPVMMEKGGYRHYFIKEICEQPRVIRDTVLQHVSPSGEVDFKEFNLSLSDFKNIRKVLLTGCGTSLYAACIGKYLIEGISGIPAEVDISSELRIHTRVEYEGTLMIGISQSGKTLDTIASLNKGKSTGAKTLAITNMNDSILQRESEGHIQIHAGPEISVASTKTFTGALAVLYILAVYLARMTKSMQPAESSRLIKEILELPRKMEKVLELEESLEGMSKIFYKKKGFLYLGRGINYPIASEGAMKMKGLAYIYAEGYPGGEMKHGPIALVDELTPVVVMVPMDKHYHNTLTDAEEVKARGGTVIAFATEGDTEVLKRFDYVIHLPKVGYFLSPILNVIPLQFFAYFVALRRGCKVDRPRNLAKSVTVE